MEPTKSQSWKPLVYLGATAGSVAVVLTAFYVLIMLFFPHFSLAELGRGNARVIAVVAGLTAYGTVVAVTRLLKKYYGREFGSYLDDADAVEPGPPPSRDKLCARCGTLFGVFHNDFHAAGFCSRACQEAFAKRR